MIVWINGPFGGGKSTTARLLREQLPGSITTDPEEVGYLLRNSLGDHPSRQRDFQDYPMWRTLVAEVCVELDRYTQGAPVIAPMTLLHQQYADEIFDAIRKAGTGLHHILIHAGGDTVRARIEASTEFPDDEELSEKVRAFRRHKLADYEHAYTTWLADRSEVIDTTLLTPDQVTAQVLDLVHLP